MRDHVPRASRSPLEHERDEWRPAKPGPFDWIAYAYWMCLPFWLCDTRLGRWLLPFAGRYAYRDTE